MYSKNVLLAASVLALASAAEIDRNDIPTQCQQVCYPLVNLAAQCERDNTGDSAEIACICNAPGTSDQLPICDACVRQYDSDSDDNDDDGDVADLRRDCNLARLATFTGPTGTATLAPLPSGPAGSSRSPPAGPSVSSPIGPSVSTPSLTSVSTTFTTGGSTRTTVVVAGATTNPTGTNVATVTATPVGSQNDAGRPVAGVGLAGVLAAMAALA